MAPFFTGISRGVGGAGFGKSSTTTTSASILADPFTSTTQITTSGVGYFQAPGGYLKFKTYCLYNVAGKNWIMAYNIHNLNASDLNYSSSYWSSRGELNVSDGNLDPTTGSTNVYS